MRVTFLRTALAVALALVGSVTVGALPAHAAPSCYGDYCSGLDPQTTGCSADAYTVASAWDPSLGALVELRWSPTCKTNWARSNYNPSWIKAVQTGGYTQWGTLTQSGSPYYWSRQIYSPSKCVSASAYGGFGTSTQTTACR